MLGAPIDGDKSRTPRREHYRSLVKRGGRAAENALRQLKNPHPRPESLRYLHEWAIELYGRSGFSEVGMNPLTWTTLDAWQRAEGHCLTSLEREALFALDDALRPPSSGKDS